MRAPPASPVPPCRPSPARSCWQPPLPGGWKLADPTYYIGGSKTCDNGDKLVHGQQGEVAGPHPGREDRIYVKFPGNKGNIGCFLTQLSRSPPVRARWCGGRTPRSTPSVGAAKAAPGPGAQAGGPGAWVRSGSETGVLCGVSQCKGMGMGV